MKILIVTGGKIDEDFALQFLEKNSFDLIIAADKGMELLGKLNIMPDYLVGDFDSVSEDVLDKARQNAGKVVKFNPVKDFTDTEAAVRLAIDELDADEITILGATGTRLDHVLANINSLFIALEKNIPAYIIDLNNRIRLINKTTEIIRKEAFGDTISLIPYTDKVEGIILTGFYYSLKDKTFSKFEEPSLGVSNVLTDDKGVIELTGGILIMIEARD